MGWCDWECHYFWMWLPFLRQAVFYSVVFNYVKTESVFWGVTWHLSIFDFVSSNIFVYLSSFYCIYLAPFYFRFCVEQYICLFVFFLSYIFDTFLFSIVCRAIYLFICLRFIVNIWHLSFLDYVSSNIFAYLSFFHQLSYIFDIFLF